MTTANLETTRTQFIGLNVALSTLIENINQVHESKANEFRKEIPMNSV